MISELKFIANFPRIWSLFFATVALIFLLSLVEIASVLPVGLLIKQYLQIPFSNFELTFLEIVLGEINFDGLVALAVCSLIVSAAAGFLALYAHSRLIWLSTHRISYALFQSQLLGADPFAKDYDEAIIRKNIATESQQYAFYGIGALANLFGRVLSSLVVLAAIIAFTTKWMLLSLLLMISVFAIMIFFISKTVKSIGVQREFYASEIFRSLDQVANSLPMILGMQRQSYFERIFFASSDSFRRAANAFMVLPQIPKIAIDFIIFASLIGLVYYLSVTSSVPDDTMLYPLLLLVKFVPGFNILFRSISERQYARKSFEILSGALIKYVGSFEKSTIVNSFDDVEVEIVWPTASSDKQEKRVIFQNVSKGDIFAFCGESGSGKSTILQALSGISRRSFLQAVIKKPNGCPLNVENSNMAYLPQKVVLINGDLAQNVVFGKKDNSYLPSEVQKARVKETLIKVGLSHLISELETPINNLANSFSGGEIQRIGFARIIYADPEIIFLDEPTSALDSENESLVVRLVEQFSLAGKLVFLATHSDSLRGVASKVLDLGETLSE